ncbi:MAG: hypothetical protein AAF585_07065, partial [Verrucomicrobiota bacterium]
MNPRGFRERWRRTPKGIRWLIIAGLALGGVWLFEDIRGRRLLAHVHHRAEKMGVSLRQDDLRPPDPAAAEDLLQSPLFHEWLEASQEAPKGTRLGNLRLDSLFNLTSNHPYYLHTDGVGHGWLMPLGIYLDPPRDYYGEDAQLILDSLAASELVLSQLAFAVQKPRSSSLLSFESHVDNYDPLLKLSHLASMFEIRARAQIQVKNPEASLEDILTILRISNHCGHPQNQLMGSLISNFALEEGVNAIWEGIHLQVWNDAQLRQLDVLLTKSDGPGRFPEMLRFHCSNHETKILTH